MPHNSEKWTVKFWDTLYLGNDVSQDGVVAVLEVVVICLLMDQNEALKAYETSHATSIPLPEAGAAAVFIEAAAVRPFRG